MKKIFSFALACCTGALCIGARIEYSGVLGQSAPEGTPALKFTGVNALSGNGANEIIFGVGAKINTLAEDGTVRNIGAVPGGHAVKQISFDGADYYIYAANKTVYRFDVKKGVEKSVEFQRDYRNVAIAPHGLTHGVGAKAKFFAIEERTVVGWDAHGRSVGKIIELPGTKGNAPFVAIGILPGCGDVVVGAYYPDCTVFRFTADGREVLDKGWPYLRHEQALLQIDGDKLWGFGGEGATEIKDNMSLKPLVVGDGVYDIGIRGIVQSEKGCFLGTTQGIKFYPKGSPRTASRRIGGLTDVTGLAIHEGRLLCATKHGMTLRLLADDNRDEIISSSGEGFWRINGNWTERIAGIASGRGGYLVLGGKLGLWRNYPDERRDLRWRKCESNIEFKSPQAVAANENEIFIVDAGRVFKSADVDKPEFRQVLPSVAGDVKFIAAQGSHIAVADENEICVMRDEKEAWKKNELAEISGMSFIDGALIVAQGDKVCAYALHNGALLSQIDAAQIPGGFRTGAVTACNNWIYVYDALNARVVRLWYAIRITQG